MEREKAMKAIQMIAEAIVEAVKAAGKLGAPAGTIYAALMTYGITLEQFNQFMAALEKVGKVRRKGLLYFAA